ncbi:MAG: hypothetical protein ACLFPL_02450 [Candidatus Nanoarchaeia archaeon]
MKNLHRYNTNKKGVSSLANPVNYIFLIPAIIILIILSFWANSVNAQQSNNINAELVALYANEISEQIYSYELPQDHRRMRGVRSNCRGLEIDDYEDSFFLQKHCRDSNTFYINIRQMMIDNLKRDLENQNFHGEYVSEIRDNKGRCLEYQQLDESRGEIQLNQEISGSFEISNALFVLPANTLYSVCSTPPQPRRT